MIRRDVVTWRGNTIAPGISRRIGSRACYCRLWGDTSLAREKLEYDSPGYEGLSKHDTYSQKHPVRKNNLPRSLRSSFGVDLTLSSHRYHQWLSVVHAQKLTSDYLLTVDLRLTTWIYSVVPVLVLVFFLQFAFSKWPVFINLFIICLFPPNYIRTGSLPVFSGSKFITHLVHRWTVSVNPMFT